MSKKMMFCALVAFSLLIGCGDDGPTTPTPAPMPPAPSPAPTPAAADIDVEVVEAFVLATGQGNLLLMDLKMVESGGLGANINFIRVEIFKATGEFEERQEIGADEIIDASDSNRLEANQTREESWGLVFRATIKSGRLLRVTVGFTDDAGNDINEVTDFIFR
jgi:hypothetical protein